MSAAPAKVRNCGLQLFDWALTSRQVILAKIPACASSRGGDVARAPLSPLLPLFDWALISRQVILAKIPACASSPRRDVARATISSLLTLICGLGRRSSG